jgi:hypothetical protein
MREILIEELAAAEGLPANAGKHIERIKNGIHGPGFEAVYRTLERVAEETRRTAIRILTGGV